MRRSGGAAWIGLTAALLSAAGLDRYPEARALLAEAEALLPRMALDARQPLAYSLADLYARGGYLDDAIRVAAVSRHPAPIISARVLYGDSAGALATARATADPYGRSNILITVGQTAWRAGDKLTAKLALAEAERASRGIPDAVKRARQADMVRQLLDVLPNDPPIPLSAEPSPRPRPGPPPDYLPPFPMTVEGFREAELPAAAVQADASYLTALYAAVAARDRTGLEKLASTARSPRQKLLGTASLAHLFLQANAPPAVEEAARSVETDGADIALAKAELLAAAGRAWARGRDFDRARICFEDAVALVKSVKVPALSAGKVKVVSAIARLQSDSRLAGAMAETFDLALALAAAVPAPLKPGPYLATRGPSDAYRLVFETALKAQRVEIARQAAARWNAASQGQAAGSIAMEWFSAGHRDEALTFARSLHSPAARAGALKDIAYEILEAAGAPHP
ncbi:MAG: hypothetical protein IT162_15465 [Bryobacterales bacterium]|nr:hypothetical protein [Bryobacterales bacterium]